ncbi:hypothetical protein B0A49_13099 [Cryomyces minteri]|uniref:Uncharacterized protein n=1 Tax=Cryomyces minteri TaxID=331657 RepID=A0A4U0VD13_9PEZI|nr:hypothetical protein B0A49_13099 [Cryomyces minteri]
MACHAGLETCQTPVLICLRPAQTQRARSSTISEILALPDRLSQQLALKRDLKGRAALSGGLLAENPTAARKALGAISGNAVPVAPARVLSAKGLRSVSLPSRYQSNLQQPRTTSSSTAPKPSVANIGSTRTIDFIAQFPLPPTAARTPAPPTPPTRPVDASPPPAPSTTAHVPTRLPSLLDLGEGVLSGPRRDRNRVATLRSLRSLSGSTRSSCGPRTPLRPTSPAPDVSFGPRSGVTDPASLYRLTAPSSHPEPTSAYQAPTSTTRTQSRSPSLCASPTPTETATPVRGEATTRYTLAGMPIYRPTAPSLRALDRHGEREHEHARCESIAAYIASIRCIQPAKPSNASPPDNRCLEQQGSSQEIDAQRCPQASDPHSPHRSSTTASRGTSARDGQAGSPSGHRRRPHRHRLQLPLRGRSAGPTPRPEAVEAAKAEAVEKRRAAHTAQPPGADVAARAIGPAGPKPGSVALRGPCEAALARRTGIALAFPREGRGGG